MARNRHYFLSLIIILVSFSSCVKHPFFAGADATILLTASKTGLELNESTTIFITGFNADGSYLWDGTQVDVSVTNGSVDLPSVELEDGKAQVIVTADQQRGDMVVRARSGSIVSEELNLTVGSVEAVDRIVASLNPPVLPAGGGTVQITVLVYDKYNDPLPGISVVLEADKGILDSSGSPLITDGQGSVTDSLNTDQETTVTIYAGEKQKQVTVSQVADNLLPSANFSYSPTNPKAGETVYFNGASSTDPDGSIQSYRWDFGDGTLGAGVRRGHKYSIGASTSKTFTVTLTVVDDRGGQNSVSKQVTVTI
jgi:hypothetical protein